MNSLAGNPELSIVPVLKKLKNSRVIRSEALFTGDREILIQHRNEYYRLMITKAGKLILNK